MGERKGKKDREKAQKQKDAKKNKAAKHKLDKQSPPGHRPE